MAQFRFNTISRTDILGSIGGNVMISAIDYDGPHNLLITGCPGSGKTTVTIMRAERLVNLGRKIKVFTFQNLLKIGLRNIASEKLKGEILTFMKWYYDNFTYLNERDDSNVMLDAMAGWNGCDEILIDEGQDFEERIYKSLLSKCRKFSVGADNAQKVHEKGLNSEDIKVILEEKKNVLSIQLQYNYRNSYEIYNFARFFLPHNERANNLIAIDKLPKGKGNKPKVFLLKDSKQRDAQLEVLLTDAGDKNVAILLYKQEEVDFYFKKIQDLGFECSKHHGASHTNGDNIDNILVTTYKSAKGLEFQVVIMPEMETAMNESKKTAEHYYIGCTRATENLFLLVNSIDLPKYFVDFNSEAYEVILSNIAPKKAETISSLDDDLPF